MKKISLLHLICGFLAVLMLAGCSGGGTETDSSFPVSDSESETDSPSATETDTESMTESATEETETTLETAPERTETEMDIYQNGYTNHMVVGFDEYGRSIPAVSARREDKEVGIFYFLWLGQHGTNDIYHIPTIRQEIGDERFFHESVPGVSPAYEFHWWETPLYGYYNSGDEWVIRRHMEMLTEAGVDFLCFDTTNAFYYDHIARVVMKVISELRAEGWDAPQVTWMTHSRSIQTATAIYNTFYKQNIYPESWYCVDGKPMIIAYTTAEADMKEAAERGDTGYKPGDMSQEMLDFFYVREPRWPYEAVGENSWPYTEWSYPQPLNNDMISVSVASHTAVPFSFSVSREDWPNNWGRGWSVTKKMNIQDDVCKGTFFDSQWKVALKRDPRFVMITGWNEWVAQKNLYMGEYAFVDNFDLEYSRDIEPMKGGYEDAFYIQMMKYIREYKYESMEGKIADSVRKTIDITGPASQWDDVNAVYRRVGLDDGSRGAYDAAHKDFYEQNAVSNDLTEIRVTVDSENIYFYIQSNGKIVENDQENWMNIFIGTGSTPTQKGWESYEFVINRSRTGNTATIERLNADFSGEKLEDMATFSVQDHILQISVPRAALGLEEVGDFYFKVADGVADPDEIMDYYTTGRSMPMGRLSYLYQIGNLD